MDLKEQLKQLFPDHVAEETNDAERQNSGEIWMQEDPIICKYEKKGRNGKPVTVLEGYNGSSNDLRKLAKELKSQLGVGGSVKNNQIVIQGNYREKIMGILEGKGFNVKRVGG